MQFITLKYNRDTGRNIVSWSYINDRIACRVHGIIRD